MSAFARILVPTDFSGGADAAWAVARRIAGDTGAELVLLHVAVEAPLFSEGLASRDRTASVYAATRRWATDRMDAMVAEARGAGLRARATLQPGQPHRIIVKTALDERAGLVVVGTHGRDGINRMLLGSVAERVIRTAPCPVLAVREEHA